MQTRRIVSREQQLAARKALPAKKKPLSFRRDTLNAERKIVFSRVLDAPRSLVFDAWTRPEMLKHWFGPRGWSLVVCEVDLRVGGRWRFVLRGPGRTQIGMRGVYREIVAPERTVYTETFDHIPGQALVTGVLAEHGGQTKLTATVLYHQSTSAAQASPAAWSTAWPRATTADLLASVA
jgi:uncharacterized protein YndB with AHSA1/START domain